MKIEVTETEQGMPKVAWIQQAAESGMSKLRWRIWRGAIIGSVVGLLLSARSADIGSIVGSMAVAGFLGGCIGRGYSKEPKEDPFSDHRDPVLVDQYCEAKVDIRDEGLFFVWNLEGRKSNDRLSLPFADMGELVVGSTNEWLSNKATASKRHEQWVIMLPRPDGSMHRIATHGGAQAEMAELHGILTRYFVEQRDRAVRKFAAMQRKAQHRTQDGGVPDVL